MNRLFIATLVLLFSGLAIAVVAEGVALSRAHRELEQLTARLDRIESRQKTPPPPMATPMVQDLQKKVATLEQKMGDRASGPSSETSPRAPQSATRSEALTQDQVQKIVDAKLEEKLKETEEKRDAGGDRKVPLRDIANELPLDRVAETRVAEISNRTKDEIFLLAKTLRPDGTNLADEILDAVLSGDGEKAKQSFMKIFSEKVPGTDRTYLAVVGEIQDRANAALQQVMIPDAWTRFQHMSVKPENIETGYDPWAEYLKQRR